MRRFHRPMLAALAVSFALAACAGKSESSDADGDAGTSGAGGSSSGGSTTGGASGSSSGGTETGGTASGGTSSGGTSGGAGTPMCASAPVGVVCLRGTPEGENERLEVGDHVRIDVRPSGCYSSSCTEVVVAACSITRSGSDFTATAEFCLASIADPGFGCTADCGGGGNAECESDEPLEAGLYTLTLGNLSAAFTVPGTIRFTEACAGSQF